MKLQIAVIGLGGMGAVHARNLRLIDNMELVGVCDIDAQRALQIGEELNVAAFSDSSQMMQQSGCAAVLIAAPHPFHRAICQEAASFGLHVLCEKPLTIQVADADAMLASCKNANVKLGVVFQQRTEPSRRKMKQLLDDGAIGEIYRIAMTAPWYRTQSYYELGAWRGTWRGEGGGILMNQAPHSLDQLLWLGLAPQSVQAITSTRLHQIEVENSALAIFDYGDGKSGVLQTSTAELLSEERIEIFGDSGVLRWENGVLQHYVAQTSLSQHLKNSPEAFGNIGGAWRTIETEEVTSEGAAPAGAMNGHNIVIRAFADAVLNDDESQMVARGEDGLACLELANAILLASMQRREVRFPLDRNAYAELLAQLQNGEVAVAR